VICKAVTELLPVSPTDNNILKAYSMPKPPELKVELRLFFENIWKSAPGATFFYALTLLTQANSYKILALV
jgi:hypothetical protein